MRCFISSAISARDLPIVLLISDMLMVYNRFGALQQLLSVIIRISRNTAISSVSVMLVAPILFVITTTAITLCAISSSRVYAALLSEKELTTRLSSYQKISSLESQFTQTKTLKSLNLKLESTGSLILKTNSKGDQEVNWTLNHPAYLRIKIDSNHLEMFESPNQESGKALIENQAILAKVLKPVYAWLSMDAKLITQEFNVEANHKSKISLEPKDKKNSPIDSIHISLDQNQLVNRIEIFEKSSDEILIRFSKTKVSYFK